MGTNTVFRILSAQVASTAAAGINFTNTNISDKVVSGTLNLLTKGSTNIGGICTDSSGNLFITDQQQHMVLKVSEGGKVNIMAGVAGSSGNNGTTTVAGASARFNAPTGICCDKSGNIYVADTGNNQIRVIRPDGKVGVIAGNGNGTAGFTDGTFGAATFSAPRGIAVDKSGNLYVADTGNHSIRKIVKGGEVITWAGSETGDGENTAVTTRALFSSPRAVAVDNSGNVYVADTGNDKIKKIVPRGYVYLFSGSTDGKTLTASAYTQQYTYLNDVATDSSGCVYILDRNTSGSRVLRLTQNGVAHTIIDTGAATTYDDVLSKLAVSPAGKLFIAVELEADETFSSSSSSSEGNSSSSSSSS